LGEVILLTTVQVANSSGWKMFTIASSFEAALFGKMNTVKTAIVMMRRVKMTQILAFFIT
jgi:hypothetical protein